MQLSLRISFITVLSVFGLFQSSYAEDIFNCKVLNEFRGIKGNFRWCNPADLRPTWNKEFCSDPEQLEAIAVNVKSPVRLSRQNRNLLGSVWKCNAKPQGNVVDCPPPGSGGAQGPIIDLLNGLGGAIQSEENITLKTKIDNPDKFWHGDGIRFDIAGLQKVPTGCASNIQYSFQMDERRGKGSTISSYAYISGFTTEPSSGRPGSKFTGFELGIGNRTPVVVQNPSKTGTYASYYGVGAIEGYEKTILSAGFTQEGHLFSRFNQGYEASASSADETMNFDTHHNYQFKTLYLGVAYQNDKSEAQLLEDDSYISAINSKGIQTIECPGKSIQTFGVTFTPKNRLSSVTDATQLYKITRTTGEVDYVVIVAANQEKRNALLEKYKQFPQEKK